MKKNKKVIVKTKDCFKLLKLIKKMGIFEEVKGIFKKMLPLAMQNESLQKELRDLIEGDIANDKVLEAFNSNPLLEEKFKAFNQTQMDLALEVVFLIVENIDKAENEIVEFISLTYDMKIEEVEELEAGQLIEKIKGIVASESLGGFFSSIFK